MVESLRINTSNNVDLDDSAEDESEKYSSVLENALFSIKKFLKINSGVVTKVDTSYATYKNFQPPKIVKSFNKISIGDVFTYKEGNLGKKISYGEFLNTIYSQATYQGPKFEGSTVSYGNNELSKHGNSWQKIAGISDNTP